VGWLTVVWKNCGKINAQDLPDSCHIIAVRNNVANERSPCHSQSGNNVANDRSPCHSGLLFEDCYLVCKAFPFLLTKQRQVIACHSEGGFFAPFCQAAGALSVCLDRGIGFGEGTFNQSDDFLGTAGNIQRDPGGFFCALGYTLHKILDRKTILLS
jgi:hypothetical protein